MQNALRGPKYPETFLVYFILVNICYPTPQVAKEWVLGSI